MEHKEGFTFGKFESLPYKPKLCPFYLTERIYCHNGFPSKFPEKDARPLEERVACAAYDYTQSCGYTCLRLRR